MLKLADLLVPSAQDVYADLDWEAEAAELRNPALTYPPYYLVPHHGFPNGYFSGWQALSWEFIEHFFGVARVRAPLLPLLAEGAPRRIVDVGAGTGTMALALGQMLPQAQLTLIDLSPYQLAAARRQLALAGLAPRSRVVHAAAEATTLASGSADLVLATLLYHELPPAASLAVAREARRLLAPGGRVIVFDAIQRALPWQWADRAVNAALAGLLREVYWTQYQRTPVWEVYAEAGFATVERRLFVALPWVYQAVIATA